MAFGSDNCARTVGEVQEPPRRPADGGPRAECSVCGRGRIAMHWTSSLRAAFLAGVLAVSTCVAAQAPKDPPPGKALATFAGGCFWCMEPPYDKLDGVDQHDVRATWAAPRRIPTYEEVSSGMHRPRGGRAGRLRPGEGVVRKAARRVLAQRRPDGEGPPVLRRRDRSTARRSSCTPRSSGKRRRSRRQLLATTKPFKDPIVTPVVAATDFWPAEDYHQDYYMKNPGALHLLPHGVRARRAPQGALGRRGPALKRTSCPCK